MYFARAQMRISPSSWAPNQGGSLSTAVSTTIYSLQSTVNQSLLVSTAVSTTVSTTVYSLRSATKITFYLSTRTLCVYMLFKKKTNLRKSNPKSTSNSYCCLQPVMVLTSGPLFLNTMSSPHPDQIYKAEVMSNTCQIYFVR